MSGGALRADLAAVREFWRALVRPGDVHEVRAPKTRGRWRGVVSGYFDSIEAVCTELTGASGAEAEALYATLNPVNPALLARAANRLKMNARETAADADILRRTTLLIDPDAVRPSGISSTDAERDAALALRDIIRAFLAEECGWTEPLAVTMSGNGGALLYRIDLPNDTESTALVAAILTALAHLFDTPAATVDTANSNAARITKILGTVAAKGDNLPDRPWRLATGIVNPEAPVVPREALARVAALAPEVERHAARPGGNGAGGQRWDLRALLTRAEIGWQEKAKVGYAILQLDRCLTSPDHADGAALFEFPSGAVAYRCLHNRCSDKRWADVRPILAPEVDAERTTKAKRKRGEEKPKAPLPPELAGRRFHPALHFDTADGFAAVGLVTPGPEGGEVAEVVTSARTRYPTEAIQAALSTKPLAYTDLVDRWRPEDVARFLAGTDDPPRFADMVARIIGRLDSLMEFRQDAEVVTVATWAVATYFFKTFLAFPRLDLRGERGSGKSKLLSILAATAFNGLLIALPTPAILYRLAQSNCPTFALDESEGLDSDQKETILAIFNMGYKAGGHVPRCEGDKTITIKSWSVFCPLAFGGIKGLNRTTEDRAITLPLVRGKDPAKINAEVDPADPRFADIRDLGYRLALLRWQEVAETARTLPLPEWLVARERELWKPLLVVAHLADQEGGLGLTADLLGMAKDQGAERAGLSEEAEAVVDILTEKLAGADALAILPGELREDLKVALGWQTPPSAGKVGRLLQGLGFPHAPRSSGGKRRLVTAEALADLRKRYGEPAGGLGGNGALGPMVHSQTS